MCCQPRPEALERPQHIGLDGQHVGAWINALSVQACLHTYKHHERQEKRVETTKMWSRKSLGRTLGADAHVVFSTAIPFAQCPAKTWLTLQGESLPGRSVPEHCHIVGVVAQRLIALYPPALQSALFPPDAPFAAACHDIGKVSPSFVEKLRRHCTSGVEHIPKQAVAPELEKGWGGHSRQRLPHARGVFLVAAVRPAPRIWATKNHGRWPLSGAIKNRCLCLVVLAAHDFTIEIWMQRSSQKSKPLLFDSSKTIAVSARI